jgi:hypothetical protein
VFNASAPAAPSLGTTLDSLLKKACSLCARWPHAALPSDRAGHGRTSDAVYNELAANLENSHMVPAGIVAVNRAQERGYSSQLSARNRAVRRSHRRTASG